MSRRDHPGLLRKKMHEGVQKVVGMTQYVLLKVDEVRPSRIQRMPAGQGRPDRRIAHGCDLFIRFRPEEESKRIQNLTAITKS